MCYAKIDEYVYAQDPVRSIRLLKLALLLYFPNYHVSWEN